MGVYRDHVTDQKSVFFGGFLFLPCHEPHRNRINERDVLRTSLAPPGASYHDVSTDIRLGVLEQ